MLKKQFCISKLAVCFGYYHPIASYGTCSRSQRSDCPLLLFFNFDFLRWMCCFCHDHTAKLVTELLLNAQQWWVERNSNLIPRHYRLNDLTTKLCSPWWNRKQVSERFKFPISIDVWVSWSTTKISTIAYRLLTRYALSLMTLKLIDFLLPCSAQHSTWNKKIDQHQRPKNISNIFEIDHTWLACCENIQPLQQK